MVQANEVLNKLFEMRDNTHIAHLQTKSYAEHKALNKFYDSIVDLADDFAEQYQGATSEIITRVGNISIKEGVMIVPYLKDCLSYFNQLHSQCDIISLRVVIESILLTITKTLYLLNLK